MKESKERKRLIVIGGGFAGLNLIFGLKHAPIDILLIDKRNHHLFQPLLYQVATATLSPRDICTSESFAQNKKIPQFLWVKLFQLIKIKKK
jgi:NADH dehydrogenase FAD-containing subunit